MKRGFLNSKKAKAVPLYEEALGPRGGGAASNTVVPSTEPGTVAASRLQVPSSKHIHVPPLHGKVENNDIPGGLESMLSTCIGPLVDNMSYSKDGMIITTIPAPVPGAPCGQSTEWLATGKAKARVLNTPGFPQPVPKSPQTNHVVKETPTMGKGVFATRDIKFAELIFAERPIVVIPRNINVSNIPRPSHLSQAQYQRLLVAIFEKQLEVMIDKRMLVHCPENRDAFKQLVNSHSVKDGSGPYLGIIHSNSYDLTADLYDEGDGLPISGGYGGISKDGSRINHSCMSNVLVTFSLASFSFLFTASKNIKAGEQLFYSYCDAEESVAQRKAQLAGFSFVCRCDACRHATPATDRLRKEYPALIQHFDMLSDQWIDDPKLSERFLDPVVALKDAMIREGLDTTAKFAAIYRVFIKVYSKLGREAKADWYFEEMTKFATLPE